MKQVVILSIMCILCVGFVGLAQAEEEEKASSTNRTSFSAGYVSPLTPKMFRDYWKPGYFIGAREGWGNPEGFVHFSGFVDLGILGFDYDRAYGGKPDSVNLATLFFQLGASFRFSPPAFPYPYASVSFGTAGFLGGKDFDTEGKVSFGSIMLGAGAGIRIPIGNMNLVLDTQYAIITKFVETVTYWPIRVELELPFSLMKDD